MDSIRVAVAGATGKMGREAIIALAAAQDMEPVGATCRQDRGTQLALPDTGSFIPLSTNLEEVLSETKPDVLVDFTNAQTLMAGAPIAGRMGIHMVTGTTSLGDTDLQQLDMISKEHKIGIIVAPNFSIGAVLLVNLAKQAAPFFDYADIVETHHEAKIDAPSGTAQVIADAITQETSYERNVPEREPIPGARGGEYKGVSIHSLRMAGRVAHHEVIMGVAGQTLTLRHDMISRDCCMPGMLRAVREVGNLKSLVIGLDKILGI